MAQKFKFRYVNEIVGVFMLLVVLLLAAGIFFAANAQKWFEPVNSYRVQFPPDGSGGLKEGSQVQMLQTAVGRLKNIEVADDGSMEGEITVRRGFARFVRKDSVGSIRKTLVLAGDSYLEISRGDGELLEPGAYLKCRKDEEIAETLAATIEDVRAKALEVLDQGMKALEQFTGLASDLRDPEGPVLKLVNNLQELAQGLEEGRGPAGAILRDPALADDLRRVVKDLKTVSTRIAEMATRMAGVMDKLGSEAEHIPGSMLQVRDTLRETQQLLEALQRHWLIRSYVEPPAEPGLLPPSTLGIGGER